MYTRHTVIGVTNLQGMNALNSALLSGLNDVRHLCLIPWRAGRGLLVREPEKLAPEADGLLCLLSVLNDASSSPALPINNEALTRMQMHLSTRTSDSGRIPLVPACSEWEFSLRLL